KTSPSAAGEARKGRCWQSLLTRDKRVMDISLFYSRLAMIGLLVGLGFLLGKIKLLDETFNKSAVNLLLSVLMPAALFSAFPPSRSPPYLLPRLPRRRPRPRPRHPPLPPPLQPCPHQVRRPLRLPVRLHLQQRDLPRFPHHLRNLREPGRHPLLRLHHRLQR